MGRADGLTPFLVWRGPGLKSELPLPLGEGWGEGAKLSPSFFDCQSLLTHDNMRFRVGPALKPSPRPSPKREREEEVIFDE